MARGIIYVMKTVVPGLVKIGKTGSTYFDARVYQLEHHGYNNVTGLRRVFAIEVEVYDEKESMLDDIFSRSRVPNSELFALDVDLVVQLLSSFEGTQVYPTVQPKSQSFAAATQGHAQATQGVVPDRTYYLKRKLKSANKVATATMLVKGGKFVVPKGTEVSLVEGAGLSPGVQRLRALYVDENGVSTEDVEFASPSGAGSFVIGASCGGWVTWKTASGDKFDVFRQGD